MIIKTIKFIFSIAIVFVGSLLLANSAWAQIGGITISPDPIFYNVDNFIPEDIATSIVTITNSSDKDYERITLSGEVPDGESDELASALELKVDDLATMDLDALLNGGIIVLSGKLEHNSWRTFDFAMKFKERGEAIDNDYQSKSVVFNFIFTFEGGEVENGNGVKMVVSGGGGGGLPPGLIILNESAVVTTCNSATIEWLTSYPATSQVIYSAEGEPRTLNLDAPNYGYTHAYPDPVSGAKVTGHQVTISTLAALTKYYYRCVSHASPATIGYEQSFTTCVCPVIVLGEEGAPNLTISKTVDVDFANPCDTVIYKVNVINNSNLTAFNAILIDILPAGFTFSEDSTASKTWHLGDIEPAQVKGAEYLVNISSDIGEGVYTNLAQVSADNHGPVSDSADLEVRKVGVLGIILSPTGFSVKEFIILMSAFIIIVGSVILLRKRYL